MNYLVEEVEKVQKRATKLVRGLNKLSYKERLIKLKLPTLRLRRARGDMIEVYKIITKTYDAHISPNLILSSNVHTRSNNFKLQTMRCKYDIRKYSFTNRVVSLWNSLPEKVVNAENVNTFKNRLDKHWENEEAYYNYEVDVTGSV